MSLTDVLSNISSAHNVPTAIARSYPVPCLGILAGDIFTVTRLGLGLSPEFLSATLTRSLDSLTSAARIPPISNPGSPFCTSTSTATISGTTPLTFPHKILLNKKLPSYHIPLTESQFTMVTKGSHTDTRLI